MGARINYSFHNLQGCHPIVVADLGRRALFPQFQKAGPPLPFSGSHCSAAQVLSGKAATKAAGVGLMPSRAGQYCHPRGIKRWDHHPDEARGQNFKPKRMIPKP